MWTSESNCQIKAGDEGVRGRLRNSLPNRNRDYSNAEKNKDLLFNFVISLTVCVHGLYHVPRRHGYGGVVEPGAPLLRVSVLGSPLWEEERRDPQAGSRCLRIPIQPASGQIQ